MNLKERARRAAWALGIALLAAPLAGRTTAPEYAPVKGDMLIAEQ